MRNLTARKPAPQLLATQAALRLAISQAEQDLDACIGFGRFLTDFQLGMLNSDLHRPWTVEQYTAIEQAELLVSTRTAIALARLDDPMGGIN